MIKPILFNTDMVRAILDGRKTVTRRLIKPQPDEKHKYPLGYIIDSTNRKNIGCFGFGTNEYGGSIQYAKPPYQPGDILYVRETWSEWTDGYLYKAWTSPFQQPGESALMKWHPSIHMPKEAARIWLKVKNVRVERLQDIDIDGIRKEGLQSMAVHAGDMDIALKEWEILWNSTIKKSDFDLYGWDANPYVWLVEFEQCEKPENIIL